LIMLCSICLLASSRFRSAFSSTAAALSFPSNASPDEARLDNLDELETVQKDG